MPVNFLTRRQVRAIDSIAINELGIPGVVLMENAGGNAARRIASLFPDIPGPVAIIAGGGNNGGDGFVIARHLANLGLEINTFLMAPDEKIRGEARVNLEILRKLGHDIHDICGDPSVLSAKLGGCSLVVDAIGGTGISGPLRGAAATAVKQVNYSGRTVVAVDIPTGLDCDRGIAEGPAIKAAVTITFLALKKGFRQESSREYTGEVIVVDIGVDPKTVVSMFGLPE